MKNKINNCDFLIVGAGLIGSLTAITLIKKNFKVVVIDKNRFKYNDNRTLAVNANSRDFLKSLNLWSKLSEKFEDINKIVIGDYINSELLHFGDKEAMGSVIFNNDLLKIAHNELKKGKCIYDRTNLDLSKLRINETVKIKNELFTFKKIILSVGKKFNGLNDVVKYNYENEHKSYVGFFNHTFSHNNIAYEYFTKKGPLAVLPAPKRYKKFSTFIFSTKKNMEHSQLNILLKQFFSKTHGKIKLNKNIYNFKISPHLSNNLNSEYILLGDSLRSIHPVAGQGWNLGVKDIQDLLSILNLYSIENVNLSQIFHSKRLPENLSYLFFTNIINSLYDNKREINSFVIKFGYKSLLKFSFLRRLFIKQAMGRLKLI